MTAFTTVPDLYMSMRRHLQEGPERVGFFLAEYKSDERTLRLETWRGVTADEIESQSSSHLVLRDEVRAEIIKWAWDAGACLVEAHSHDPDYPASFSPSDIRGLDEWVRRLWWRLRGRPYGALVLAGRTFDALAWIDGPDATEQVEHVAVGSDVHWPTALTLPRLPELRAWSDG